MKWYEKRGGHYYCDEAGKIIGTINLDGFGNYRALYEYTFLGVYIELRFARNAVEDKHTRTYK